MNTTISSSRRFFVSGQPFEIWDNPDRPFGWTQNDLESYATDERWELLFNALVIAGSVANATAD